MAKESLVVHVRKLFFKKYMKNHKIIIFFLKQSKGEENNIRKAHTSTRLKKIYWDLLYFYSVHD